MPIITATTDLTFELINGVLIDADGLNVNEHLKQYNVVAKSTGVFAGGGWPEIEFQGEKENVMKVLIEYLEFDKEQLNEFVTYKTIS